MIQRRKFILVPFLFIILISGCQKSDALNNKDMLILYNEYDELFYFNKTSILGLEKSDYSEIITANELSDEYRDIILSRKNYLVNIIQKNIDPFKDLYNLTVEDDGVFVFSPLYLTEPHEGYEEVYYAYQKIDNILRLEVLEKYSDSVRIMWNVLESQAFVIAKELEQGKYAVTPRWPQREIPYWSDWYMDAAHAPDQTFGNIVKGIIKYREWYYESNLKYRIVIQIRDEEGNYLGELATDFYKFDDFNKLFTSTGEPKS